jgi:hypothetical protein
MDSESSILSSLLAELAEVFLKAEGAEDAVAAAEAANEESENLRAETLMYANRVLEQESEISRLREQVAEAQEVAHQRDLRIKHMSRYCDVQAETIRNLQGQLNTARRSFGDAFVYGQAPGTGPTRANRPKLTPAEVRGIRSMVRNGSAIKSVASLYGVHPSTISRIARGFYYREVA